MQYFPQSNLYRKSQDLIMTEYVQKGKRVNNTFEVQKMAFSMLCSFQKTPF